jgi:hypothetical protein
MLSSKNYFKGFYASLFAIALIFSACNKTEVSPIDSQKTQLMGTVDRPVKWHLYSYTTGSTMQPLTYAQKNYIKTFGRNGLYIDSDGFSGSWDMPAVDQLKENYTNFPSGSLGSQTYTIVRISSTSLTLQHTYNGVQITSVYDAVN